MCWHYSGLTAKTKEEINRLWGYIQDSAFNPPEELTFSLNHECGHVRKYLQDDSNPFQAQHGWIHSFFDFLLIKEGIKYASETDLAIPLIHIENAIHRSITDIMKSIFTDSVSLTFHLTPFKQLWTTAVTEIPMVDKSSEWELLSLLGNWYKPETFESAFSSLDSNAVFFSS